MVRLGHRSALTSAMARLPAPLKPRPPNQSFAAWPPAPRLVAQSHRRICHALGPDFNGPEAADRSVWQPPMSIWQHRFTSAPKTP